ncbi:MAG: hypothetical protein ACJ76S_02205 [Solirubrobacteraceae bacterium]
MLFVAAASPAAAQQVGPRKVDINIGSGLITVQDVNVAVAAQVAAVLCDTNVNVAVLSEAVFGQNAPGFTCSADGQQVSITQA